MILRLLIFAIGLAGIIWISLRFVRLWRTGVIEINSLNIRWKDSRFMFILGVAAHFAILYCCVRGCILFVTRR